MGQKYGAREERKGGGQGEPGEQTCVELEGGGQVTFRAQGGRGGSWQREKWGVIVLFPFRKMKKF